MAEKYWTKELCSQAAAQYTNRSTFKTKFSRAYKVARVNKWLDEICLHMVSPQMPSGHWQKFENVLSAAHEAKTFANFVKLKGPYASALANKWLDDLGLIETRRRPNYWTKERLLKLARGYKTQFDFKKNNPEAYQAAAKKGLWKDLQLFLTPTKTYWNFELCKAEAVKYKTRSSFNQECPGAYGYASKKTFWMKFAHTWLVKPRLLVSALLKSISCLTI